MISEPLRKLKPHSIIMGKFSVVLHICLLFLATSWHAFASGNELVEDGLSLYRYGRMLSGEHVGGIVQGDIVFSAKNLACINCHRRSGLGSSEGSNLAPAITASVLFSARGAPRRELPEAHAESHARRPAYTDETLIRALHTGVDAAGRMLDPLMPRYLLDDAQVHALVAYLKTLGEKPAPGVDDAYLHLATIITPGVSPGRRDTMLGVLETFFNDRGAHTRNELRRASRAPWHIDWKLEAYREIRLHTWSLTGPPNTWASQLEQLYAEQPVFALVSGIGSGDWAPIHDFCEANELPSIFPNTELPEISADGFYSLYFHQGMTLEGQVVARYLTEHHQDTGPVLQVFASEPEAITAAAALRERLSIPPEEVVLRGGADSQTVNSWDSLRARYQPSVVVVWARNPIVEALLHEIYASSGEPPLVIFSGTLAPIRSLMHASTGPVYAVQLAATDQDRARGEARVRAWLRSRGLEVDDVNTALNTYFAATMTAGAIKILMGNYSREYIIERIEHGTENSLSSGAYQHLSLGPDQRFASRGAHIVPLSGKPGQGREPLWIVP